MKTKFIPVDKNTKRLGRYYISALNKDGETVPTNVQQIDTLIDTTLHIIDGIAWRHLKIDSKKCKECIKNDKLITSKSVWDKSFKGIKEVMKTKKIKELIEVGREVGIVSTYPVTNLDDESKNCLVCGHDHSLATTYCRCKCCLKKL